MKTRVKSESLQRYAVLGVVAAAAVFAVRTKAGFASLQYPDDTFRIHASTQTISGLSRVLSAPTARAILEPALETNTIWHIVSEETDEGTRHTFFLAGHKRKSGRFQAVTFVLPNRGNQPPTPSFHIAGGNDTEPPAAANRYELEILRDALVDPGVSTALIEFVQTQPVRSLCVAEDPQNPTGLVLVAQAPPINENDLNPARLMWRVERDDRGDNSFVPYND